jgi:hypothetical protein
MAKVFKNILVQGLIGSLGKQLVFRRGKGGQTIVSRMPAFAQNRKLSAAQKAHHQAFQQAAAYAKLAKGEAVYIAKAEGTALNPYNVALSDWFHAPEVLEVDTTGWTGEIGQTIRIKAVDDVMVTRVSVAVRDRNQVVVEEGNAIQSENDQTMWIYTTQTVIQDRAAAVLTATAEDLPGHTHAVRVTASL